MPATNFVGRKIRFDIGPDMYNAAGRNIAKFV